MSQQELARVMMVSPRRVNEIVLGKRSITADTAVRLADALAFPPLVWMALQAMHDIHLARQHPTANVFREPKVLDPRSNLLWGKRKADYDAFEDYGPRRRRARKQAARAKMSDAAEQRGHDAPRHEWRASFLHGVRHETGIFAPD